MTSKEKNDLYFYEKKIILKKGREWLHTPGPGGASPPVSLLRQKLSPYGNGKFP
jgi:hypothetical protein